METAERGAKRLVIVADNSLIIEAIRIGLRRSGGFKVLGRADGRATSVRAVVDANPDVVLMDDMPDPEAAISLIRGLKAEDESIAIVLLTARMAPEWLDEAFTAGACGAISKLIDPRVLGTVVRETVNGNVVHLCARNRREQSAPSDSLLTAREQEILGLAAGGATNGEIARRLWVTEQTVKFHLSNLYRKLGVANRTEASHYAHLHGLVEDPAAPATDSGSAEPSRASA
jgi:DNA-binding NarL/FixJ family response regulator